MNVVVGDNGSGKTALLEALFLAVGTNPETAVRFRSWRGADSPAATGTAQEIIDGLFLDLFHNMSKDVVSSVSLNENTSDPRLLRIYYEEEEPTVVPLSEGRNDGYSGYNPVTLEWRDSRGQISKLTPRIGRSGLVIPPFPQLSRDPTFLTARAVFPTSQNARWFSDFSKLGQEKKFISALQAQFNNIESISVEVDLGSPVLFVKMPWHDRKMPIYMASDGLNKLMTLLIHIAHSRGASMFVDEIENGFHYTRHQRLWEHLFSFAEEYETQLFMATHSWEYLEAGSPLMEKFPDDFTLLQVVQDKGVSDIVVVPGRNAGSAIAAGLEVRAGGRKR
jgi:hypothetical protein